MDLYLETELRNYNRDQTLTLTSSPDVEGIKISIAHFDEEADLMVDDGTIELDQGTTAALIGVLSFWLRSREQGQPANS